MTRGKGLAPWGLWRFDSAAAYTPTLYRGDCLECGRRFPNLWLAVSHRRRAKPSHSPLEGSLEGGRAKCPRCSDLLVGWWTTKVVGRKTTPPKGCPLFEMMNNGGQRLRLYAGVMVRRTSELGLYDRTKCDFSDTTNTEEDKIHPCGNARKSLRQPDRIVSGERDCAVCKRVVAARGTIIN